MTGDSDHDRWLLDAWMDLDAGAMFNMIDCQVPLREIHDRARLA